jgi:hypothetical protein
VPSTHMASRSSPEHRKREGRERGRVREGGREGGQEEREEMRKEDHLRQLTYNHMLGQRNAGERSSALGSDRSKFNLGPYVSSLGLP